MTNAPEGMVSVEQFAKVKGNSPSKIIDMIRDGFYVGRKVGEEWYVDPSELDGNRRKSSGAERGNTTSSSYSEVQSVVVTDIQMSFISMVVFMVKWVIASIPAFIILIGIFLFVTVIFGGVIGGLN